jgi:hypothetical protein
MFKISIDPLNFTPRFRSYLDIAYLKCYSSFYSRVIVGAWRSLEAHLNGVQGVGGSNPLAPTNVL